MAARESDGKCLGAMSENGHARTSWPWHDGRKWPSARINNNISWPQHDGSKWPSMIIQQENYLPRRDGSMRFNDNISCLDTMAAQESTIKLVGLGQESNKLPSAAT